MKNLKQVIFVILVLGGCAMDPATKTIWLNDAVPDAQLQAHWTVDKTECLTLANQHVALPNFQYIEGPEPEATGYMVHGRSTTTGTFGSYSESFSGSVTPQNSFGSSFQRGLESGRRAKANRNQMEQYEAAVQLRADYRDACLIKRGWRTEVVARDY